MPYPSTENYKLSNIPDLENIFGDRPRFHSFTSTHTSPPPLWKLYTSQPSCSNGQEWQGGRGGRLERSNFCLPPPPPRTSLAPPLSALELPNNMFPGSNSCCRTICSAKGSMPLFIEWGRGGGGSIKERGSAHISNTTHSHTYIHTHTPFRRHHTNLPGFRKFIHYGREKKDFSYIWALKER